MKNVLFIMTGLILPLGMLGCAGKKINYLEKDRVNFIGDQAPLVTSSLALKNDFANLTDGETVFVATSNDGTGVLSKPDTAILQIQEPVLSNESDNISLIISRCDTDGDGNVDVYCPELESYLENTTKNKHRNNNIELYKYVNFRSWYTYKPEKEVNNQWSNSNNVVAVDLSKQEDNSVYTYLNLYAVNTGNKAFEGDIKIVSKVPVQINDLNVIAIDKIAPNTATKTTAAIVDGVLAGLTGMTVAAPMFMTFVDDYKTVETDANLQSNYHHTNREMIITANGISILPGQGVRVQFRPLYLLEQAM